MLTVVALLVVVLALFFVFGDVLLGDEGDNERVLASDTARVAVTVEDGDVEDRGTGSSGSSDEARYSEGIEEDVDFNCRTREVQYSLKNFREDIVCREGGTESCEELVASCSVEVYNLDDSDGVFEIEYSLKDSDGKVLDSVVIERNVVSDGVEVFSADFIISENADENSSCVLDMKGVPLVEVCS